MKSSPLGKNTSEVEVLNISSHGIWLYVAGEEYFLPYKDYPWFKGTKVEDIIDVKILHGHHLHWPRLDVDLELESLKYLDHYPLKYA